MKAPDRVILEALEHLKAKAERKAQAVRIKHDPIMCPCESCRKAYRPMQITQRHMVIDSTFRERN